MKTYIHANSPGIAAPPENKLFEIVPQIQIRGDMYTHKNGERATDLIMSADLFTALCAFLKEENNNMDPYFVRNVLEQNRSVTMMWGYRVSVVVDSGMWFVFGNRDYIRED